MSVLGQGKIPGHSGTEFKHKKAFQGRRLLSQRKLPKAASFSSKIRSAKSHKDQNGGLKITQAILFVATLATMIFYVLPTTTEQLTKAEAYVAQIAEQEALRKSNAQQEIYAYLIRSADNFYQAAEFLAAQEEYELALRQFPNGKAALTGMTLTLLANCQAYGVMCPEAAAYLQSWPAEEQAQLLDRTKESFAQWEGQAP